MLCSHQQSLKNLRSDKMRPLALAMASLSLPALSLNSLANTEQQQRIEEVYVWGTEVKASNLNLAADSIAIKQADHLSDLLRIIPGVDLGGSHSLNQRITIRSLDDKDLRVSIDGANQNTYMFHHMGNLQIHADILKSADIQVGNNSVLNGGLGGVVRFQTRDAADLLKAGQSLGGRINATAATNGSNGASLIGYGKAQDIDFLAYANAVRTSDFEVGGGEILDFDGEVIPGTDGKVRGLEGDVLDALIKVGNDFSENQRVEFGYEYYKDEGDYSPRPDMGLATDLGMANAITEWYESRGIPLVSPLTLPTEFTRDTLTLNYDANFEATSIEIALYTNLSNLARKHVEWIWDEDAGETPAEGSRLDITAEGESKNYGLNAFFTTTLNTDIAQTLTYGLDFIAYETHYALRNNAGDAIGWEGQPQAPAGEKAKSHAIFIQDRIELGNKLSVTPGARFESWDTSSHLVDKTFSEPTFALALVYQLFDQTILEASSTQLFKGPELAEVFVGAGRDDAPNPDIKAETGTNTELGFNHQGDTFNLGVKVFETIIKDYIFDSIDYTLYSAPFPKDNIGDLTIDGAEAFVGFKSDKFDALFTYSMSDSELEAFDQYIEMVCNNPRWCDDGTGTPVVDAEGNTSHWIQEGFDGARTDRTQGDTYSLELNYYPTDHLQLHYDAMYVASLDADKDLDGAPINNAKDSFNVHNISVRWETSLIEGLTLTAGVDNLFDEFYASHASRTGLSHLPRFNVDLPLMDFEPGRNIKASVAYQF